MAFKFAIHGKKEKTIEKVLDGEGKTSLGIFSGNDIGHCIDMASRHCDITDDFLDDVKYYRVCGKEESLDRKFTITVEFYK